MARCRPSRAPAAAWESVATRPCCFSRGWARQLCRYRWARRAGSAHGGLPLQRQRWLDLSRLAQRASRARRCGLERTPRQVAHRARQLAAPDALRRERAAGSCHPARGSPPCGSAPAGFDAHDGGSQRQAAPLDDREHDGIDFRLEGRRRVQPSQYDNVRSHGDRHVVLIGRSHVR